MVVFKSPHPVLHIPEDITVWQWLFESKEYSPFGSKPDRPLGGFTDVVTKERLDFAQVKAKSTALSSVLVKDYDLKPGDVVTIFSGNTIWYPVCMFSVARAGALFNGASAALTTDEMAFALETAKAKIVICPPSALDRVMAATKHVGIDVRNILLTHGLADGFSNIQDLIAQGEDLPAPQAWQLPEGKSNKDVCVYLNFSSGTTGLPKAVMVSHHNVMANGFQTSSIQVDPHKVNILAVLPMFHITGMLRFCHSPIYLNGEVYILPAFTMPAMLQAMVDYHIEELISVPPILLRLARDDIVNDYDLRHVKRLISGAAPISTEVLKSLQERFPWTGFRQGYGATETSAAFTAQPKTHYDYKYGVSQGVLINNCSAKVIDENGKELGPNQTGEIYAKGPTVVMGYLDNPEATAETFDKDGYFRTGDSGYFTEDGWLYIRDRIKEMIKVKATQVPPAELEDLLLGHEDVVDCAVTAQPDEYAGERPKAYIVLKQGLTASEAEGQKLLEYVRKNKTRYKWLVEVEFIDQIPKSAAGKILRKLLKEHERKRDNGEVINGLVVKDEERSKSRTQDQ